MNRSCVADAGQRKTLNQFIGFDGRRISIVLSWKSRPQHQLQTFAALPEATIQPVYEPGQRSGQGVELLSILS